ncbi:MAG: sulfur carrier protein ThiS [Spirochaetales bacterium]|nr:sulfur carrier protein ThiS [Spirochaetales bacterium]
MKITLNGNEMNIPEAYTLYDLLEQKKWKMVPMSVKIDGRLIPRQEYSSTDLKDEQTLQIVPFLAGG